MSDPDPEAGQTYAGLGCYRGWRFIVRSVHPANAHHHGKAVVWEESQPEQALNNARASIEYLRALAPDRAEDIVRRCTEPREETREFAWFRNWLKAEHIRLVPDLL